MKAAVHPLREITVGVDQPETGREKGRADWESRGHVCSQRLSWMRNGWLWVDRILADRFLTRCGG